MFKKDLRNDARNPFVEALEYSVTVTGQEESQNIEDIAVCVDLSSKGIGILTNHPLRAGHIVDFKNGEKTGAHLAKRAEVKWTIKIDDSIYRAGLKFS
jgi:PilZ domain